MEEKISEFINPRKLKWTIYGSFINLAIVFVVLLLHSSGIYGLPFDVKWVLIYGLCMTLLSIKNTRMKYEKLDTALSVQPIHCPQCQPKNIEMLPMDYKCPECNATFKKEG